MNSRPGTPTETSAGTNDKLPVLYVKLDCPACADAVSFMDEHGIPYRMADISREACAAESLFKLSGQGCVPTLDWFGNALVAFGPDELVPFLRSHNVELEDS